MNGKIWTRALLVAAFTLAALNLRPAIAGISPLLIEIRADLGLNAAAGGAITTVMVLCLGVVSPLAPVLARRFGLDRTLLFALLVLAAGVALRGADGVWCLYAGAVVVGTAIAVMNVIMPGVVKQHFPERVGLFTGVYVSALVAGAAAGSALMVPLAEAYGWRLATASAAVLALAAAALWWPQVRPGGATGVGAARGRYRRLLGRRMTWYVTGYMGVQSMAFYIMLAWLPTIFRDAGLSAVDAGNLLGLTNFCQIAVTLLVPAYAARSRTQAPHAVISSLLTIAGFTAIMIAPTTVPWLWMIVLAMGQGSAISLALLIITLRAPDPASVTALSAVAQSIGYVFAAAGPVLIGLLHGLTEDWTLPLAVAVGLSVVQLVVGALAGRPAAESVRRVSVSS
ncbi:MFS transporter [Thermopolyspora sp. NPDC052614]|uniref:CynX/NimT family MFS transporter n=1 Tax=Thermopolyspora sp. NPDC052614 TaxID=3155682 RepID=UPI003418DA28